MKTGAARKLDEQNPTPETFIEEIRRIINSGTLRGAREVAEQGLALFPDDPELQRLHHVLRPFEVRVSSYWKTPDPRPNYEWLKKNARKYRGKWVGLDRGELVAAADTLEEVLQAFGDRDPRSTLVHHILA
ncbi:MAG TPA: DUF5678 domain-containing protein [Thermoanaerobaculia bacterium]